MSPSPASADVKWCRGPFTPGRASARDGDAGDATLTAADGLVPKRARQGWKRGSATRSPLQSPLPLVDLRSTRTRQPCTASVGVTHRLADRLTAQSVGSPPWRFSRGPHRYG